MPLALPLPDAATTWGILGAILVLCIGGFARWWNSAKPARERAEAGWDAILGGSDIRDRSGALIQKGQPGLVHRVTQLEVAVVTLADQQAQIKAIRDDLGLVRTDVDALSNTVAAIIADKWEHGAQAALKAVEKQQKNSIDGEVDK